MINYHNYNIPIYSASNFSQVAQEKLVKDLLQEDFFQKTFVQRQLASYPIAYEDEKGEIVLRLMEHCWSMPEAKIFFSVFRDFDTVFEILGKKGHFIHQFEVFLLGYFINQKLLQSSQRSQLLSNFHDECCIPVYITGLCPN